VRASLIFLLFAIAIPSAVRALHLPWVFDAGVDAAVREERILDAFERQVGILARGVRSTDDVDRARVRALIATGYLAHRGGHQGLASELLDHAADVAARVLGPDDVDRARALVPLGISLRFCWRRAEADSAYREAARILAVSPDPVLRGCLTHAEADFLRHLSTDDAIARFARAAGEIRAATGESLLLADVLVWWSWNLCQSGRAADAMPLLAEADSILVAAGFGSHSRRGSIFSLRADSLAVAGDVAGAIALLREAAPRFEGGRAGLFPGPSTRLIPPVADRALAVLHAARGEELEAFEALQRMDGFLSEPDLLLGRWSSHEPAIAARHDSLGRAYLEARDRSPTTLTTEDDWEALVGWLELRTAVWTLERAYLERHPLPVASPEALARTLPPGTAFVADVGRWFGGDKRSPVSTTSHWQASFVLRDDGTLRVRGRRTTPGVEEARSHRSRLVATQRALLRAGAWSTRIPVDPALTRAYRAASEGWADSLLVDLEGASRVLWATGEVFVPSLLVGADGRSFGERFILSHVPSSQSIPLLTDPSRRRGVDPVLVVAAVPKAPVDVSGETLLRESWFFDVDVAASRAAVPVALPELDVESRAAAPDGRDGDRLIGAPATVDTLIAWSASGRLARYGLVHVIGHTYGDPDPEACGVLLPGSDRRSVVMTPDRVRYGWRLHDPLVVLSGCRTGQGAGYAWGEFPGRSSYFAAGARAIVASMWPVDDLATSTLMGRFHRNLGRGLDPALALSEAKTWTAGWEEPGGTRPFAHPVYWSAFRLIGGAGEGSGP